MASNELDQKISKQIEYYFGDINLPRDKFLQEKIKQDDGWVTIEVLLTFKRLANLSTDQDVIAKAVQKSDVKLIEVSEDLKKVRRSPEQPLPELNDERRKELMTRSAYAKGFPLDESLHNIINFLEPHGPIESCIRRTTKDHKFKGSCFVIFKDIPTCKKFVDCESVKYGETELIRKLQTDYVAEKKKEIEERKKSKKEKKSAGAVVEEKPEKTLEFPKGAILFFTGIAEGQSLTREDIKEKIKEAGKEEVAYIDFNKGDSEGYVRMQAENKAKEFHEKLTDGGLEVGEAKLTFKVLEGDEEEEYLKKTADAVIKMRQKQKFHGKMNRKRKGNFGNGRDSKRRN